jgi:hypothetical protein
MKKSHLQLLSEFADASDELLKLKIITTDSFTGEIGEYVACQHFKLIKAPKVTKDIDATDTNGYHYQVKSKVVSKSNFAYRISNLNPKSFKYLVVVYFDELYKPLKILKIDYKVISGSEYNIPANISINQYISVVEGSNIKVPAKAKSAITKFAETYNLLKTQKIIRSRHVVGDIGEYFACLELGLKINEKSNEKGIDAVHPINGLTFEVKTRRVYKSERREGEGRRLNGLTGKSADYLVVVTLNREFKCSGMWIMPMKNIVNPKSAHLTIVNTTIGVECVVPSQIDWLKTGKMFSGFGKSIAPISKARSITHATSGKFLSLDENISSPKFIAKPKRRKLSWMDKDFDLGEANDLENNIDLTEKYPLIRNYPSKNKESKLSIFPNLIWVVIKWLLIIAILGSVFKTII